MTSTASPEMSAQADNGLIDETMGRDSSWWDTALVEEVSRRWHTAIKGPPVGRGDDIADHYDRLLAAIDIADRTPSGE